MEIRQFRYFLSIADTGSFSRAAQVLHIAQPALSQQIAQLEGELGEQLLVRHRAGVQMTQQGEVFYRHAQRVLKAIAETALAVQGSAAQAAGRVSLGLPQSTAEQYAMPLLQALREHHPAIELEVFDEISGYLLRSLLQGRLDMAVIVSDEDAQLLASQALFDEELFLVSRSDMAPRKKAIDMKAMCALPLALPGMAHGVRARVELAVRQAALILPTPVVQANSMRVMRRAVLQGLAHAIMPWAAVAEELQEGRMQITPLKPRLSRRVYLCTAPDSELSLAGQAVHALLRERCIEDVRSGHWQGAALI
jgi:LysR family transcriptional regulator, nitrogen assimilation regulatory protein